MKRLKKLLCWAFGCDWVETPEGGLEDGIWLVCSRCGEKGCPLPIPEGFFPFWKWRIVVAMCGFIGHPWHHQEQGDSGEWVSTCTRCGIDGESEYAGPQE